MGIFSLLILIPVVLVCAVLAAACLKLAKKPVDVVSVVVFTVVGGLVGVATVVGWGFVFANGDGMLASQAKVVGMFIAAGVSSVICGLYASTLYSKHNKQRQHRPSGWTR